jgi:hypothetical protein
MKYFKLKNENVVSSCPDQLWEAVKKNEPGLIETNVHGVPVSEIPAKVRPIEAQSEELKVTEINIPERVEFNKLNKLKVEKLESVPAKVVKPKTKTKTNAKATRVQRKGKAKKSA